MSQSDVLAALETSLKADVKAAILDLNKDGGVIAMEVDELAVKLGSYGPALGALLKPFVQQLIASVAAKI